MKINGFIKTGPDPCLTSGKRHSPYDRDAIFSHISALDLYHVLFLIYLYDKPLPMTEIEKLDRIAITVRSHKLLRQLLSENPELAEILRNSKNETEVVVGVREWIEHNLKERKDAFRFYHAGYADRELFEKLEWRDYAIIRILDYIDHAGKEYRGAVVEYHSGLEVRFYPDEGMSIEVEVLDNGHIVDHHMIDGMHIGVVSWEEYFLGSEAAAGFVAAFDESDLKACPGEVGASHEAVGPCADDYGIPAALFGKLVEYLSDQWIWHCCRPLVSVLSQKSYPAAGCTMAMGTTTRRARSGRPR